MYIFSRPRRAFFKIVCGLYEEMERSDENSSLRNWISARNFLKNLFWPLFLGVDCSQLRDASIKPLCRVCSQKLKFLWPTVAFFELSEYRRVSTSRGRRAGRSGRAYPDVTMLARLPGEGEPSADGLTGAYTNYYQARAPPEGPGLHAPLQASSQVADDSKR